MNFRITELFPAAVLCGMITIGTAVPALAAEMEFKPFLAVSEEFTDNVFEVAGKKRHDFITRLQPGLNFHYLAPFWKWDLGYNLDYRHYARNSHASETSHNLNANGNIALIDNFFHMDVSDVYKRVSLDVARDSTVEGLSLNQSDQNVATVSPYLLWRPGDKSTLRTGYRFIDTRYWDSAGIERQQHQGFADLNHEITSRFSLTAGYTFTRLDSLQTRYNKHDVSAGFRYEYADKSFVYGQIGNSWQQFDQARNTNYLFWSAGVTHDFNVLVATFDTKVQNSEDPLAVSTKETSYSGRLDKTFQRGAVNLSSSYSEYVDTATSSNDRSRLSFSAGGNYEVLDKLKASLSATMERYSAKAASDYPYRYIGTAGLSYAFKDELTLGLTYSYITSMHDLDTTADAKQINRVVVEVRKAF